MKYQIYQIQNILKQLRKNLEIVYQKFLNFFEQTCHY